MEAFYDQMMMVDGKCSDDGKCSKRVSLNNDSARDTGKLNNWVSGW